MIPLTLHNFAQEAVRFLTELSKFNLIDTEKDFVSGIFHKHSEQRQIKIYLVSKTSKSWRFVDCFLKTVSDRVW